MSRNTSTLIGFGAVLSWALLALLSVQSGKVPPFQLTAMTFFLGGLVGMGSWLWRPQGVAALKQDWRVWLHGVAGLFLYHATYFAAISQAPAIEVSLIAYLWPLFIVVLSVLLLGESMEWNHVAGVVLGLMGAFLVITRGDTSALLPALTTGHLLAFACAFIWSIYSVLARRFKGVPSDAVTGFCLATAALSLACHLVFETTVWPATALQWLAILVLGVFPLGLGFYAWDHGMKHGDIMVLGALSYATPILSTLVLLAAGLTAPHWSILLACVLVVGGALLAAKDLVFGRQDRLGKEG